MKYAYKTRYGSPEAAKVKAAGAKWNPDMKLWLSETPVDGLEAVQPNHTYVWKMYNEKNGQPATRTVNNLRMYDPEKIPDEAVAGLIGHVNDGTFLGACCVEAIKLYTETRKRGLDTQYFWSTPDWEDKLKEE
ncbi:MAG TPA: hypothetical protein DCZ10_15840 [Pelotomaculum sp.]|nr:hypothetical protein [Pelotomaculum sp.]